MLLFFSSFFPLVHNSLCMNYLPFGKRKCWMAIFVMTYVSWLLIFNMTCNFYPFILQISIMYFSTIGPEALRTIFKICFYYSWTGCMAHFLNKLFLMFAVVTYSKQNTHQEKKSGTFSQHLNLFLLNPYKFYFLNKFSVIIISVIFYILCRIIIIIIKHDKHIVKNSNASKWY